MWRQDVHILHVQGILVWEKRKKIQNIHSKVYEERIGWCTVHSHLGIYMYRCSMWFMCFICFVAPHDVNFVFTLQIYIKYKISYKLQRNEFQFYWGMRNTVFVFRLFFLSYAFFLASRCLFTPYIHTNKVCGYSLTGFLILISLFKCRISVRVK